MTKEMKWQAGTVLKPLEKPEITREQLRAYADVSGDVNPIHLDEAFAKQGGFPSVIVHGMISMAFMGDHIRFNFPESDFTLVRMRTRFRKVTFPGDRLTCEGEVKKVNENNSITVGLRIKNQKNEITTDGEAEILSS